MVNSAGKMLREARLKKNILIEEAARSTKIRPNRLAELECDDYSHFANMAYARGFLLIYAKYLGVDVSEFTRTMDVGNPVGVGDYEYLREPRATYEPASHRRQHPPKQIHWKLLITVAVLVFCVARVVLFLNKLERVNPDKVIEHKNRSEESAVPKTTPPPPAIVPTPVPTAMVVTPSPAPEPPVEVRRAEPVTELIPLPSPTPTDVKKRNPNQSRPH